MSKRGVFWGLGGLLGVVLATTLCILLVTVMGTGAQNSSQSSVEPQVTNLPTGETSDYEIAESPEVEQRAPSYQTPFQPNDGPSVALGPLPSESPPEASFAASSSPVARGADDMITAMITVSGAAMDSTKVEGETATVTIELSSPLPTGLVLADDDLKLVATNDKRWPDLSGLDENGSVNLVNLFGNDTRAEVPLFVVDDMILERDERVRLILEASSNLQPHFNLMDPGKDLIVVGDFDIIDNEDGRITIVAEDGSNGAEITTVLESGAIYPVANLPPGVVAEADIRVLYELRFVESMDENGNVRTPLSPAEISGNTARNLTIQANENRSSQGTITLNGDAIPEETEWFQLVLLGVQDRADSTKMIVATVDNTPLNITVLDNDPLEYAIEGADAIDEGAGSYTVQLRRKGRIFADLRNVPGPVTVPYTVSGTGSSEASPADFAGNDFPSGSFTFSGYDALSDEVSIMIENDGASEFTETFKISVTGGTSTPKEVAIIDDDPPGMPQPVLPVVVGFDARTYRVNEASGTVELTVEVIDGVLTEAVMLTYTTTDASATSPDDYTGGAFSLTLPAMARSVAFTIPIVDDSDVEGDELFTVALSSTLPGVFVNPISATVTIINNDVPQVTVRAKEGVSVFEIGEKALFGGNVFLDNQTVLEVALMGTPSGETLVIGLAARAATINDGGTAADVIFLNAEGTTRGLTLPITSVTLYGSANFTEFAARAVDDDVVELSEKVNLYVATVNGIPITDNGLDITIVSDDNSNVDITVEDGPEGGRTMATIDLGGKTLSSAIPSDALRLVLADGSTMNADVEIVTTDIVAGLKEASTVNVPIILKDDDLVEGAETVVVELRIDSTIAPGLEDLLTVGMGSFTIIDNDVAPDPVVIGFDSAMYSVNEASGTVELTVEVIDGVPTEDLTLTYTTASGSATSPGDYTGADGVSIPALSAMTQSVTFRVAIMDDMSYEPEEEFTVELSGAPAGITLDPATATVTIMDDEAVPQLSLHEIASIREGMAGLVTATLDIASGRTITVELTPSHTDAQPADYSTPTTLIAMIPPGEFTATFTIMATPDGIYEGPEMLEFTLSVVGGGAGVTAPRSRQLSILDGDSVPSISFVATESTIAEDATNLQHDIELQLSGQLKEAITVTFMVAGSATRSGMNADYTLAATTVTIPAETRDAIIQLDVNNDDLYDGRPHETVVLSLVSATGGRYCG